MYYEFMSHDVFAVYNWRILLSPYIYTESVFIYDFSKIP